MEKVALLRCSDYNIELIEEKLREGFELLGGEAYLRKLIPFGSKVLLKPNLVSTMPAGSPAITHYAVFEAVVRIIKDYAGSITFGDSPGIDDSRRAAEKAGLIEVSGRYGVKFEDFKESVHLRLEDALLCQSWDIARAVHEADVVISLPKLKTHAMAYFTGAVKNQFGCVPGTQKAAWHTRMPNPNNFSRMLLDLNRVVGTDFAVLDGIVAMEGNGPRNGTPRKMDAIIMGSSLTAVDSTAVRLIGYDNPLDIPVLNAAYDAKWGTVLPEEIEVVGEKIQDIKIKDFVLCRESRDFNFISPGVTKMLSKFIAPNPTLTPEKCVSCSKCFEVCPQEPKAITMVKMRGKDKPKWDMSQCIRCFCCQELCPVGAIKAKHPPIGRIIGLK